MQLKEQNNIIEELTQKLNIIKTQTDYSSNNNEIVLGNLLNDSAISYTNYIKPTYIELENMLEDKEQLLKKKLQQEKNYEKTINELKNQIDKYSNYESLKTEVSCLHKNNEMLNKQIDMYKEKINDNEKMYNDEIKIVNDEFIKTKCMLASITYEKDTEILKLKKHIKKFQEKLFELGFAIVPRNK
jgi:peptidoglycan hydrolase CwlO-like protein